MKPIVLTFLMLFSGLVLSASADMVAYQGKLTITDSNDLYTATHFHDWSLGGGRRSFKPIAKITVTQRGFKRPILESQCPALTDLVLSQDSRYLVGLSAIKLRNSHQLIVWDLQKKSVLWQEPISSEVAILTLEEFTIFDKKFPKVKKQFPDAIHVRGNEVTIDGSIPSNPELGKGAWKYLYDHWKKNPYSPNFAESVTNFVYWYYPKPDVRIEQGDGEIILSMLDPKQMRFSIHIPTTEIKH